MACRPETDPAVAVSPTTSRDGSTRAVSTAKASPMPGSASMMIFWGNVLLSCVFSRCYRRSVPAEESQSRQKSVHKVECTGSGRRLADDRTATPRHCREKCSLIEETMALHPQFPAKEANLLERPGFAANLLEILRALPLLSACKVTRCRWERSPNSVSGHSARLPCGRTRETSRTPEQIQCRAAPMDCVLS